MPAYSYNARSRAGEKVSGSIEAPDRRSALMQLERQGYVPVSVTEGRGGGRSGGGRSGGRAAKAKGGKAGKKTAQGRKAVRSGGKAAPGASEGGGNLFGRGPRMKMRDMLLFTQELSDLLSSGMTLGNALNTLSQRDTNKAQDDIIRQLRDDIVQGSSLSAALKQHPASFSSLYVSMVKAGEASGTLPEVLERLCYHYQRVQEAKEKVLMALIYPSIILMVGALTMIFALVFVIPRFMAIFDELGSELPFMTQILVGISDFLLKYWWLLIALGIGGWVIFQRALRTEKGLLWWHGVLLSFPLIKNIVAANAFAHFARTLGALLTNGVPVLSALSIVEDTVGNKVIGDEIHEARDRVTDGATISTPLAESNVFPVLLTDMLAVGEQSGDMSGALAHIANRYDRELDRTVKIFTTVLEPIMILLMAVMVGFVAVSMLMAVFNITSGIQL